MKFRKVTSSKYVGEFGYSLRQMRDGSFSIVKGNTVTKWGSNFQTVRAAENFLSQHDYKHASAQSIPISDQDSDLIYDMYCSKGVPRFGSRWHVTDDFWIQGGYGLLSDEGTRFKEFKDSDGKVYRDADELVCKLDTLLNSSVLSSVNRDELDKIFAAGKLGSRKRGGLRPNDLMRVKSSNVWAIGVEVNNDDMKYGTVYVQFKAKEGGPGDIYRYYDVPVTLYRKFVSTPSFGAFVWKYLRNNFAYSKLTGDKRGKLRNAVN